MEKAWNADVKNSEKLVLLALADNASDEGYCWPSWDTIMAKTGISSKSTLSLCLRRLEDAGLIRREHRKRKSGSNASNAYWVLQDDIHSSNIEPCHSSNIEPPTVRISNHGSSNIEPPYEPSMNRHDEPSPSAPSTSFANDGLFNAVYSELRLSGAQKYLGAKQNVYAAYLTVKAFIGIRDLAVAYKRYTMSVGSGENIVGLATFIENEMYLSFLPKDMTIILDDGQELSGIMGGGMFQTSDGKRFEFTDARFVEKLMAGDIKFNHGATR
jgi:hypothetical protein